MLYFKLLCFFWAAIGIVSRIAMGLMKDKWAVWEENSAYKAQRPAWVVAVALIGVGLILITWYIYLTQNIAYGWILSGLITLTALKIFTLLFQYDKFRVFLKATLRNKQKMMQLNVSVIILSIALVGMGIFLYN